jgi:hypothetical protein
MLAICDNCGFEQRVTFAEHRAGGGGVQKTVRRRESITKQQLSRQKWACSKKSITCPDCAAANKSMKEKQQMKTDVKPAPATPETTTTGVREPTKQQKREILQMLEACYDSKAEMYCGGETDNTVAEAVGVLPGWVAQLREEFFGGAGNEDIQRLSERLTQIQTTIADGMKDMTAIRATVQQLQDAISNATSELEKRRSEVAASATDLDKIKKSLGAHALKKAGTTH